MAERFRLPCPSCSSIHEVESRQAGESIACRSCGKSFEIPTLRGLRSLAPSESAAGEARKATGAGQFLVSRSTFAIGLVTACLGLAVGGGLWYSALQLKTGPAQADVDQLNSKIFAAIDRDSATEFWSTWHEQIIARPPGKYRESQWAENRGIARTRRWIGSCFLGLVPLGLAAMIGSAFIRK